MPFVSSVRTKLCFAIMALGASSAMSQALPTQDAWGEPHSVSGRYMLLDELLKAINPDGSLKLHADRELSNLKVHIEAQNRPLHEILSSVAGALGTAWRQKPDGHWVLELTTPEQTWRSEYARAIEKESYRAFEESLIVPKSLVGRLRLGQITEELARTQDRLAQTKETMEPGWQGRADALAETAAELEQAADEGRYAAVYALSLLNQSPSAFFTQESAVLRVPPQAVSRLKDQLGRSDFNDCYLIWSKSAKTLSWSLTTVFTSALDIRTSVQRYISRQPLRDDSHRTAWNSVKDQFSRAEPLTQGISPSPQTQGMIFPLSQSLGMPIVIEATRVAHPFSDNQQNRPLLKSATEIGAWLSDQKIALSVEGGWCVGRLSLRPYIRDMDVPETLFRSIQSSTTLDLDSISYFLASMTPAAESGGLLVPTLLAPGSSGDLVPLARFWLSLTSQMRSEALASVPIAYQSLPQEAQKRFQTAFFANILGTGGDEFRRSDLLKAFDGDWNSMYFYIDPYVEKGVISEDGVTTVFSTPDQVFVAPPPGTTTNSNRTQYIMYFGTSARKAQRVTLIANKMRN